MELDAKIQELSRQIQEASFKQRKQQIQQQLRALEGEEPANLNDEAVYIQTEKWT